jgi:hypothetical protein
MVSIALVECGRNGWICRTALCIKHYSRKHTNEQAVIVKYESSTPLLLKPAI